MSGVCDTCQRDRCRLRMDGLKTCDMRLSESKYERLFGTPERAARTMAGKCCDCCECVLANECGHGCREGCLLGDASGYDALLEWLESEV